MKYGMNHDAESLHEKMGMSPERMKEIAVQVKGLYFQYRDEGLVPFLTALLDNFKEVELVWASMGAMRLIYDQMTPVERYHMEGKSWLNS